MKKLIVNLGRSYDILIDNGLIDCCGSYIKACTDGKNAVIISDSNVFSLYGSMLKKQLEDNNLNVFVYLITPGESSKTLTTADKIIAYMGSNSIQSQDTVVALGGGVPGDIAGFVASVYKRGMNLVQIPTSLIAQADSSVGGKNAVNSGVYKNLIGTFHQPKLVVTDTSILSTLDKRHFYNGMAEVIKCGCIQSRKLFENLLQPDMNLEDAVFESVCIKKNLVEADEHDKGLRRLLNFGHTIGHAVELLSGMYLHGEAVAIGMCKITEITEKIGLTKVGTLEFIKEIVARYKLPTEYKDISKHEILGCIANDKKATDGKICIAYLESIGVGKIKEIELSQLEQLL